MAINKVDWPTASTTSYTPSISTDYNDQNNNLAPVVRGYNAVSLTNWDATTTAPEIDTGSSIESNGVLYNVTTDTVISTTGASAGTVYLIFDDTAGSEEFKWTDTAPTWYPALNGWYVSGDRFTGHVCTWDASTAFSVKREMVGNNQSSLNHNQAPDGAVEVPGIGVSGDITLITATSFPHVLPRGYIVPISSTLGNLDYVFTQFYNDTAWTTVYSTQNATGGGTDVGIYQPAFISDGVRYRFEQSGGVTNVKYAYYPVT